MRILIVEDEEKLAKAIKIGLEKQGYAVDTVFDGTGAEKRILLYHKDYDLIVLDLMLPGKSGFDICKRVRAEGITVPILILTARSAIDDKITALDCGADDYLLKPFSFEELAARIRALTRRPEQYIPTQVEVGKLQLSPATRKAYYGGKELPLTLKEFSILEYLMRNSNRVLTREQIYSKVWDFADDSLSNVIDVHMKNLRKKLGNGNKHNSTILETVRGIGYRLNG